MAASGAAGAGLEIMVDANQGWRMPGDLETRWDVATAARCARALEPLGVVDAASVRTNLVPLDLTKAALDAIIADMLVAEAAKADDEHRHHDQEAEDQPEQVAGVAGRERIDPDAAKDVR